MTPKLQVKDKSFGDVADMKQTDEEDIIHDNEEEEHPLPKWEWLLISAAAIRTFFPIFILIIILMGIAIFLLMSAWGI